MLQGAVAQLGERLVCNQEATGSIPVSSTKAMNSDSNWFPRRRWFGVASRTFCFLPFVVIGFVENWKIGLVLALFGISFVMTEKRWHPKKPRLTDE